MRAPNFKNRHDWQSRRREFNHDWLKNRFIVALNSWLQLLDGAIEDSTLEKSFFQEILPQWEAQRDEVNELIQDFEREMSPQQLFNESPLSRCDLQTKQWLGELVHQLWLIRISSNELTTAAKRSLSVTEELYAKLARIVRTCSEVDLVTSMRPHRRLFERFRDASQKLGAAISDFPHEVEVV